MVDKFYPDQMSCLWKLKYPGTIKENKGIPVISKIWKPGVFESLCEINTENLFICNKILNNEDGLCKDKFYDNLDFGSEEIIRGRDVLRDKEFLYLKKWLIEYFYLNPNETFNLYMSLCKILACNVIIRFVKEPPDSYGDFIHKKYWRRNY